MYPSRDGIPPFFFSPFNVDIDIVRVTPFFLELVTLLPEAAFVETFAVSQVLGEIRVHVTTNFFRLNHGRLHRLFVGKRKVPKLTEYVLSCFVMASIGAIMLPYARALYGPRPTQIPITRGLKVREKTWVETKRKGA